MSKEILLLLLLVLITIVIVCIILLLIISIVLISHHKRFLDVVDFDDHLSDGSKSWFPPLFEAKSET